MKNAVNSGAKSCKKIKGNQNGDLKKFSESKPPSMSKKSKKTSKILLFEQLIYLRICGMMCGYKGGADMAKRRSSGDGMVRKRDDGRWEGRIVVGHKSNGNPIYRYVLAKTQAELTQKLHDKIEMYRGADLSEDCNMTLDEWLDKWLNEYVICYVRPNTLHNYTAMINNQIKPHLGNRPLSTLTTQDIQKFYNTIKKKGRIKTDKSHGTELADSMVRSVHMLLHKTLDMALKQKLIINNPTNGTTIPKNNYAPKQILNDEQLDKFLTQIKQDKKWCDFFTQKLLQDFVKVRYAD